MKLTIPIKTIHAPQRKKCIDELKKEIDWSTILTRKDAIVIIANAHETKKAIEITEKYQNQLK